MTLSKRPIIFGEVLFDDFGDNRVLGGAPFNVAWHLHGFGARPLMISRIGQDSSGEAILDAMKRWGMTTAGIQLDAEHPTGIVKVTHENGEPSYEIVPDQAYDFINAQIASSAATGAGDFQLLYHGTLGLRNEESRQALKALRKNVDCPVFFDINLRPPWWSEALIADQLTHTHWLKANRDELDILKEQHDIETADLVAATRQLIDKLKLTGMVATEGADGAHAIDNDGNHTFAKPPHIEDVKDTVGAGDAFTSVIIFGMLNGWDSELTLNRAVQFSARICGIQGATTEDRALYDTFLKDWKLL